jgi:regulator of protease activity HflC (stomatin/prohibitin superfamily)
MTRALLLLSALVFSALSAGCYGCTQIEPGHAGVKVNNCSGGGVQKEPLGIGYQTEGPCEDIIEFPTYQQTFVLGKTPEGDQSVTATSSEGLPINIDVSLSYTVDTAKVPSIYEKYRKDLWHIQTTFITQTLREAIQDRFAKYTAEQLYSDKKETVRKEIFDHLVDKTGVLATDGFHVTQFTISRMEPPSQVLEAIKGKVAMIQEAQRTEQEVRKKKALAEQSIVEAEARAQAVKLAADAEAYANKKRAEGLTPALVEYIKVQKWDGRLPQVSGSGASMIQLKGD